MRDVGRRLTGDIGSRHGSATWRMGADMANQRRLLSDDAGKPSPNGSGTSSSAGSPNGGSKVEPWMTMNGGFGGLSGEHQDSARHSYAAWGEANPEAAAKHGLESYVGYVQEKQAERSGNTNTIS